MGKSKVRGGAKVHRKKVENRNQNIKTQQSAIQKLFNETMKLQMEELKKQYDANKPGGQQPTDTPRNASEMMLTTNDDIIKSIPPDDETTDLDITSIKGLEVRKENIEPTA